MSYVFHRHCHAKLPTIARGEGFICSIAKVINISMLAVALPYQTLGTATKLLNKPCSIKSKSTFAHTGFY